MGNSTSVPARALLTRALTQLLALILSTSCGRDPSVLALSRAEAERRAGDGYRSAVAGVTMLWSHSGPAREIISPYLEILLRQGASVNADQLRVNLEMSEDSVLTLALCEETRGATESTILSRLIVACRFRDAAPISAQTDTRDIDVEMFRYERDSLGQRMLNWSDGVLPWTSAPGFHRFFDVSGVPSKRLEKGLFRCHAAHSTAECLRVALLLPLSSGALAVSAEVEFRSVDIVFSPEFGIGK